MDEALRGRDLSDAECQAIDWRLALIFHDNWGRRHRRADDDHGL